MHKLYNVYNKIRDNLKQQTTEDTSKLRVLTSLYRIQLTVDHKPNTPP